MNGLSSILSHSNFPHKSQMKEKLIKNSSATMSPFICQIRMARKNRIRKRLEIDFEELKFQIRRVTQSQSILLEQLKEKRASRLQSNFSTVKLEPEKRNLPENYFLPAIKTRPKIKQLKKNATTSNLKSHIVPEKPRFVPCVHNLIHKPNRSKINFHNSPKTIIDNARKTEKLNRVKELVLKSRNNFTNKTIELETDINHSLIESIKAKLDVYLNKTM